MKNLVLGVLFSLSFAVQAQEATINQYDVNGYKAYVINTHNGNGIALTFNVQAGSLHDEPTKHAGMAHLWEHTIFLGSTTHPGKSAFDDKATELGADWNAYTSDNRIFYHLVVHPEAFKGAADLLGAMVSKPGMVSEDFLKELEVVIDEANSYAKQDLRVLLNSTLINLLPKGDRWAMYKTGTEEQLRKLTLDHMKALYQANYKPGSAQIIVAGNFDGQTVDQPLSEAQVVAVLKQNFFPPKYDEELAKRFPTIERGKDVKFPSIVSAETEGKRFVEISTAGEQRLLLLNFEIPENLIDKPYLIETIHDYFNLPNKGSVGRILQDRGLISQFGAMTSGASNRGLFSIVSFLTEKGSQQRDEIIKIIFDAVHDITKNGISPELLKFLRERNLLEYQSNARGGWFTAEYLAKSFDHETPLNKVFDFDKTYGAIDMNSFQEGVASIIKPSHMIGGYIGPDVDATQPDPVFSGRKIRILDTTSTFKEFARVLSEGGVLKAGEHGVELTTVPLEFSKDKSPPSNQKAKILVQQREGEVILLKENHQSPMGPNEAATYLSLQLPLQSFRSQIALSLFITSFRDRYANEWSYLRSMLILENMYAKDETILIEVSGNSQASKEALPKLLSMLLEFQPTDEEIQRASKLIMTTLQSDLDSQWQAKTAVKAISDILRETKGSPFGILNELQKGFTADDVVKRSKRALHRADRIFSMTGSRTEKEAYEMANAVNDLLPRPLTQKQRDRVQKKWLRINKSLKFWTPLAATKGDETFGQARAYPGPDIMKEGKLNKDYVSLLVMQSALSDVVFQLNRSEKGLGYVHGAALIPLAEKTIIGLYGQTDGLHQLPEIEKGWEDILAKVQDGSFPLDFIERAKRGFILKDGVLPEVHSKVAEGMRDNFLSTGHPDLSAEAREMVRDLKPEEVLKVAQKYLTGNAPRIDVLASKAKPKGCGNYLSSLSKARKHLKK